LNFEKIFFLIQIEVAKHFGGLSVTDFPVYVQGLELRQSSAAVGASGSAADKQSNFSQAKSSSSHGVSSRVNDAQSVNA
jgi:hypothetical protein